MSDLPPLPEPDTHCWDEDARRDVWSHSADQMHAYAAAAVAAERETWSAVLTRCVRGIDHLSEIARLWEPDHSSGADRRGWLLAKDARDDAAELLAAIRATPQPAG